MAQGSRHCEPEITRAELMHLCLEVFPFEKGKSKLVKRPYLQPAAPEKLIAGARHVSGKQILRVHLPNSRLDAPNLSATSASTLIGSFGLCVGKTAFFHNLARKKTPQDVLVRGFVFCLSFDACSPTYPESKQLRRRLLQTSNQVRTREGDPILPDRVVASTSARITLTVMSW